MLCCIIAHITDLDRCYFKQTRCKGFGMYLSMCVCMYVGMYLFVYARMDVYIYVCMCICTS